MNFLSLLALSASPTPGFSNPSHISGPMLTFFSWINSSPILLTLLSLMAIDVVSGLVASLYSKQLSSSASWRGMSKKTLMILLIGVASVLEPFAGGIPLSKLVGTFYIVTEALSILENASRCGVPLPGVLVDALAKLKEAEQKGMVSLAPPPVSVVVVPPVTPVEMKIVNQSPIPVTETPEPKAT